MGLDIYLVKKCDACDHHERVFEGSYNYNVSPIWYEIYPDDKGMIDIDNMTGSQALPKLLHAKEQLIKNRQKFIKMEPENKWGNYVGFCHFIDKLIVASLENPELVWESWR